MSDGTDKLASTYEQSEEFVQKTKDKVQKASDITKDVISTANQAQDDLNQAKQALSEAQDDIMSLVQDVGDIVDSIQDGDIPSIAMAVKKTVELVASAIPKYTSAVGTVTSKADYYHNAVKRNKEALQTF